jgi:hypothetical protein
MSDGAFVRNHPNDKITLVPPSDERVLAPSCEVDQRVLASPTEIEYSDEEAGVIYGNRQVTGSKLLDEVRNREDRPSVFSSAFWDGVLQGYSDYQQILKNQQQNWDEVFSLVYPIYLEREREQTGLLGEFLLGMGEQPNIEERVKSHIEEDIGVRPTHILTTLGEIAVLYFLPTLFERAGELINSLRLKPTNLVITPWGTRDLVTGRFVSGIRGGIDPEEAFINEALRNGFKVLGRRISIRVPFGNKKIRVVDVVLESPEGKVGGIEIKSSIEEFAKWDKEIAQQFANDRYINRFGAEAVGENARSAGITKLNYMIKIQWSQ